MKYFLWTLRIAIGLLFIFSGLVKANDPLGLTYKMDEVFEIWNMNFMAHYTFALSVLMIAFEIIAGVAVIVGNSFRAYVTLLLLLNIFYTFLTGYALFTGKIKECGCFGNCIPLSNTATFYKDVALSIMTFILFVYRARISGVFSKSVNFSIVFATVIFSFGIQWWTYVHLPFVDCLAYKAGNNLWSKMQTAPDATAPVYQTTFVYQKDGVKKDFTSENYPWQDSTWVFVSTDSKLIKEGTGQPAIPRDFAFSDSDGTDRTQAILTAKGYTFIWFLRDPDKAGTGNIDRLRALLTKAETYHIPFYLASSAGYDVALPYRQKWGVMDASFVLLDGTVSKTAMRSNPGLMLLQDGVVIKKWSYSDYPSDMTMNGEVLECK
jgi:uncharacterized membrane protein YphA (DoxX/SURF4 family)